MSEKSGRRWTVGIYFNQVYQLEAVEGGMSKAIVFDLGGTLMEFVKDFLTALNAGCDFVYINDLIKNEKILHL